MPITQRTSGPLFTGEANGILRDGIDAIERDVADEVTDRVRTELGRVLKNPTGYYRSRVTTQPAGTVYKSSDGGVVYGPWLEGVGSRNARSRFKGYSHWRRIRQEVQARAAEIADRAMKPFIERMK